MQLFHRLPPEIEKIVKELRTLGKNHPLAGNDLERAKLLMAGLKLQGFTNDEICILSRGTWSIPTIKLYTRGVLPRRKGAAISRELVDNTLLPVIQGDISIEDIRHAIPLKKELDSRGLSWEDIFYVIDEAKSYGMSVKQIFTSYYNLNLVGLTTNDVSSLLGLRHDLEEYGVSPNEMRKILADYHNSKQLMK